jgi:hypothetical protein
MAQQWKEWYLQDGKIKVCRGEEEGEAELSMYEKGDDQKYEMVMKVVGLSPSDTDNLAEILIKKYDTEKVFSKSPKMGTSKTDIGN